MDEIFDKMSQIEKKNNNHFDIYGCKHHDDDFAVLNGATICTKCGFEKSYEHVYILSYNRVFSYRAAPVYNRQKRFYEYIMRFSKN